MHTGTTCRSPNRRPFFQAGTASIGFHARHQGYQSLIPYFSVPDVDALLAFVKAAFGAEERSVIRGADGGLFHAEARIGDCALMAGKSPTAHPNSLYMYVPDVDALYKRAMAAPGAAK